MSNYKKKFFLIYCVIFSIITTLNFNFVSAQSSGFFDQFGLSLYEKGLFSINMDDRINAIRELKLRKSFNVIPLLCKRLKVEPIYSIRNDIIQAIGEIGIENKVIDCLWDELSNPANSRIEAIKILFKSMPQNLLIVSKLKEFLQKGELLSTVVPLLSKTKEPYLWLIANSWNNFNIIQKNEIINSFENIDDWRIQKFIYDIYPQTEYETKQQILKILNKFNPLWLQNNIYVDLNIPFSQNNFNGRLRPLYIKLATDENADIIKRQNAIKTLGFNGRPETLILLKNLISNKNDTVSVSALEALGNSVMPEAANILGEYLLNKNKISDNLSYNAIVSLGKLPCNSTGDWFNKIYSKLRKNTVLYSWALSLRNDLFKINNCSQSQELFTKIIQKNKTSSNTILQLIAISHIDLPLNDQKGLNKSDYILASGELGKTEIITNGVNDESPQVRSTSYWYTGKLQIQNNKQLLIDKLETSQGEELINLIWTLKNLNVTTIDQQIRYILSQETNNYIINNASLFLLERNDCKSVPLIESWLEKNQGFNPIISNYVKKVKQNCLNNQILYIKQPLSQKIKGNNILRIGFIDKSFNPRINNKYILKSPSGWMKTGWTTYSGEVIEFDIPHGDVNLFLYQ